MQVRVGLSLLSVAAPVFLASMALGQQASAPTSAPATGPARLPFTLGKETTIITTPLLPDGMPDYIAVLNERNGKGVTPDTNALVLLLQMRPAYGALGFATESKLRDRFLELAGAKATPANAPVFEDFSDYLKSKHVVLTDDAAELDYADSHLWIPDQHAPLVEYLTAEAKLLDLAVEASERPHFYFPFFSGDGHLHHAVRFSYRDMNLSALGRALCTRAMFRASSGNFDDALGDALAVKRLARLVAQRGDPTGTLLAAGYEGLANQSLAVIVATGRLSAAQCDSLAKALDLPPIPSVASFEPEWRWGLLDWMMLQAADRLEPTDVLSGWNAVLKFVDASAIDWNEVLQLFNATQDQFVSILRTASIDEMKQRAETFRPGGADSPSEFQDFKILQRRPDELPKAYTQRVGHWILSQIYPQTIVLVFAEHEQRIRDANLRSTMLPVLLAVAKFKSQSGRWPETLQGLIPNSIAKIPTDPYSPTGAPLRYDIAGDHPVILSVGPDHTPDTADDILVGDTAGRSPR